MEDTCALSRAYQNTARRCGGRTARLLSSLLPSLGQDHRRLCAAYFLITGERYTPASQAVPLSGAAPWQLRSLFLLEQQRPPNCPTTPQALRATPVCGSCSGSWSTPPGCGQGASAHCWSRCDAP